MFLQLVNGGHLMILVTRASAGSLRPPFPSPPLLLAILGNQSVAVLMSGFRLAGGSYGVLAGGRRGGGLHNIGVDLRDGRNSRRRPSS